MPTAVEKKDLAKKLEFSLKILLSFIINKKRVSFPAIKKMDIEDENGMVMTPDLNLVEDDENFELETGENGQELDQLDDMDIDIEEEEEEEEDIEDMDDDGEEYTPIEGNVPVEKTLKSLPHPQRSAPPVAAKRGRPRLREIDDLPEGYEVVADEIITDDDPKGDMKIDSMGNLFGGRRFKVGTFKIPGKGQKLFAISTDVARCVGYRDSYFLFQRHIKLLRVTLNEEMKLELINNGVLPTQFKTRHAYLVAARSMYKEFGAKLIQNGKQITDDYYEDLAREAGGIEGAPAILTSEIYNTPANSIPMADKQKNIAVLVNNNVVDDSEIGWMLDHASKTRQFESMLLFDRSEVLKNKSQRDVYTGLNFVPDFTQSTRAKLQRLNGNGTNEMIVETVLIGNNTIKTGLNSVPLEIFEDCVDEETKQAILQQQQLEADCF